MTQADAQALIHAVPLFAGISEVDLNRLAADCRALTLEPGEILVNAGEPSHAVFLVVNGELDVLRDTGNDLVMLGVRGPGEVVGEMALLTRGPRNATLRARTLAHVLEIDQETFADWLERHPGVAMRVLETIVSRLQDAEGHLVQQQHLTALGTLAAGLAHELNNPASALLRTAGHLDAEMQAWANHSWDLGGMLPSAEGRIALANILSDVEGRGEDSTTLNPLERSDRERHIATWLTGQNIAKYWRLAPVLVENGWTTNALQDASQRIPTDQLETSLHWLASAGTVKRLLHELRLSTRVISDLVGAVKSYSRLDEAPLQNVDIHAGIEQSLLILRHKLRDVEVIRDYMAALPTITANPGELNQLWTNLIDNAAEATERHGRITLRTRLERDAVVVEIEDDGTGVPPEIRQRLFEPFFTTRPPGEGTGLGLAISHSIVQKHRGHIEVDSEPGRTIFRVSLPLLTSA